MCRNTLAHQRHAVSAGASEAYTPSELPMVQNGIVPKQGSVQVMFVLRHSVISPM
jgi:hypothetical protein